MAKYTTELRSICEEDAVLLNQIFEAVRGFAPEYNLQKVLKFWSESRKI